MWVSQAIAMRAGDDEWLVETGHRDPMFVRPSTRMAYPVHRVRALTAMPGWLPPDADWLPKEAQTMQLATHRVRPELRRQARHSVHYKKATANSSARDQEVPSPTCGIAPLEARGPRGDCRLWVHLGGLPPRHPAVGLASAHDPAAS